MSFIVTLGLANVAAFVTLYFRLKDRVVKGIKVGKDAVWNVRRSYEYDSYNTNLPAWHLRSHDI
jgi:hypothetical protein